MREAFCDLLLSRALSLLCERVTCVLAVRGVLDALNAFILANVPNFDIWSAYLQLLRYPHPTPMPALPIVRLRNLAQLLRSPPLAFVSMPSPSTCLTRTHHEACRGRSVQLHARKDVQAQVSQCQRQTATSSVCASQSRALRTATSKRCAA